MPRIVDIDQRRHELAAAAAQVIARAGVDGATMRDIAAEAGWTTGTLAHYFANKHELLDFTLRASLERRSAQRSARAAMAPADAIGATLRSALPTDEATRVHWVVTVALAAAAAGDDQLAATQRDAYRDFRSYLVGLLIAAGCPDDRAAVTEAERLIALVDGISLQALFDPTHWSAERQRSALDDGLRTACWAGGAAAP